MSRATIPVVAAVVERWRPLAEETAARHELIRDVGVDLLLAMVCQESAGKSDARRPEPGFLRQYRRGIADVVTGTHVGRYAEWWETDPLWFATSIGLLQVLNIVAIERGVDLPTKEAQADPAVSFEAGGRQLRWLLDRGVRDHRRLLRRWNGAAIYADETLAWRDLVRRAL